MKKHLLISAMALVVVAASSSAVLADNAFCQTFKGIGSQFAQDAQSVVKDVQTSANQDVQNKINASKKARLNDIQNRRNAALAPIDAQIAAKQKEIAAVNSADMLETERTLRLEVLTRQLKMLQMKRANIAQPYDCQLKTIK